MLECLLHALCVHPRSMESTHRKATITVSSIIYQVGPGGSPVFLYSTKGIGSDKIRKFQFPHFPAANSLQRTRRHHLLLDSINHIVYKGAIIDIVYDKYSYMLVKVGSLDLTAPDTTSSSGDENTALINEPSTYSSNPLLENHQNYSNLKNLTFLFDNERYYIHSIPSNRIFVKVLPKTGTPFVNENGERYYLSTVIGEIKIYRKHITSGKEIDEERFQAPQYVYKKGMNY